jgi:hypothetical protein
MLLAGSAFASPSPWSNALLAAVPLRSVQIKGAGSQTRRRRPATGEPGQVCSMLGKGPSVAGARDRWSRCCFIIVHALLGGVLRCRSKLDRPVRSGSARPAGRPATATPSSVPSPGWHAVRPRTPRARACLLARVWAGARAVLRRARPAQPSGGRG